MKPILIGLGDAGKAHLDYHRLIKNNSLIINEQNNKNNMNIGMGNEAGLSLVRHKSIDLSPYYYGEKIRERKPFTSQQRKKKKIY